MGQTPHRPACWECGEPLILFQPTCEACGVAYEWTATIDCTSCGRETDVLAGACEHCGTDHSLWRVVEGEITAEGPPASVWKAAVPRPSRAGYRRHLGSLKGQWADYRRLLADGTEFHVLEFTDRYEIHRDEVSALDEPAMHVVRYTPRILVATVGGFTLGMLDSMLYTTQLLTDALESSISHFPETRNP